MKVRKKKKDRTNAPLFIDDGNSTKDVSALLTHQVTMATNLTAGADPRLDKKLDHILEEFVLARGGNHKIKQVFKEENLINFEVFQNYELDHVKEMKRKQGNTTKSLNNQKVIMVYNVIRYYQFR